MRLLTGLFLTLIVFISANFVTKIDGLNATELSDKIIRQMLLSPDGSDINFEILENLVERLISANLAAAGKSKKAGNEKVDPSAAKVVSDNNRASTAAIDDYLTYGKQPSTSKFLGLSSMCDICASIISVGGKIIGTERVWPTVIAAAKRLCPRLVGQPQYVCDGYVDSFGDIVYQIFPTLIKSPYSLCNFAFSNMGCGTPDHQHTLWEIALPAPLPDPVPQPTTEPTTKDRYRVLLMTDIHIDLEYQEGATAFCVEPMCCRNTSTPVHDPVPDNEKAGYWGDYRVCDLPMYGFDEILRHVNETHGEELDFVFVAGDLPAHDTWNQTSEIHMGLIDTVARKVSERFPGKPVFFAVGNHEVAPVNSYPLEGELSKFSAQWLFDKFADVWMKWLDPAVANATVRYAGFYTVQLKPGWRLISMNDNYCLRDNFFLFGREDISDPYGLLKWLVGILTESEKIGERVHIIGHIPPGDDDCVQAWSWNYYRIISRFAHIITGQQFGHIHRDYFIMYYDAETLTEPKSVAFVGPPSTPYRQNNIAYRIYDFDPATFAMLDSHTWYADVVESNKNGDRTKMSWNLEYSAKDAYQLPDMSAKSWSDFAGRMQTDFALFSKYKRHHQVSADVVQEPCGTDCRRHRLCESYQGLSQVADSWCEHFFPDKKSESDDSIRKCSARFLKRPDLA